MPVFSLTWERYRRYFGKLITASVLSLVVILAVVSVPIALGLAAGGRLTLVLLAIPFLLMVVPFAHGIFSGALGAAAKDEEPADLLGYGKQFYWRLLGLTVIFFLLGGVVGVVGWLLEHDGFIGGLVSTGLSLALSATQTVAFASVVVDDDSVSTALTRAFEAWRHFKEMFLLGLMSAVVGVVIIIPFAVIMAVLAAVEAVVLAVLLGIPLLFLIQPFISLYPFVRYVERIRNIV